MTHRLVFIIIHNVQASLNMPFSIITTVSVIWYTERKTKSLCLWFKMNMRSFERVGGRRSTLGVLLKCWALPHHCLRLVSDDIRGQRSDWSLHLPKIGILNFECLTQCVCVCLVLCMSFRWVVIRWSSLLRGENIPVCVCVCVWNRVGNCRESREGL